MIRQYKHLIIFLCVLSVSAVLLTACQTKSPVASQEPSHLTTQYSSLIKQLGDADWQTRESAQKELTQRGEGLIEQYRKAKVKRDKSRLQALRSKLSELADALRRACQDKADPEIKMRAKQIRQHLYSLTQPKIAFVSNRDGNEEIYVMPARPSGRDADGRNQKNLTKNGAYDYSPAWSPDGTKITFMSRRDGNAEIYVMDADGDNQKRLTENPALDYLPAWSPDGTRIAFASTRDDNFEIYVMDADGRNQRRLTENQAKDNSPAWSPDGTKIAFMSVREEYLWEIYVMDTDGRNQRRLTRNQVASNYWPVWNPNGTGIAFASVRDGNPEICVMDRNGNNQNRLTKNQAIDIHPAWSPDGTKIAFVSGRDGNYEIYVMDADGKNQKRLTENPSDDTQPAWCPLSFPEISTLFAPSEKNKR